MSKLNLEKKAEIVAHYLNTSDGYTNTANIFGISESVVKMLVAQFKANGIEGLTHKNGTYSGDFKLHVLEYQKQHNLSDKETAVLFKIPMLCFRSSLSSSKDGSLRCSTCRRLISMLESFWTLSTFLCATFQCGF